MMQSFNEIAKERSEARVADEEHVKRLRKRIKKDQALLDHLERYLADETLGYPQPIKGDRMTLEEFIVGELKAIAEDTDNPLSERLSALQQLGSYSVNQQLRDSVRA